MHAKSQSMLVPTKILVETTAILALALLGISGLSWAESALQNGEQTPSIVSTQTF